MHQIIKDQVIEIPQTPFKFNSREDIAMKQAWAAERQIMLTDENLLTYETYEPMLYTRTWSKTLGLVVENKKDSRQLGHLPLYAWSYLEKHGKSIGVVDMVWDSNQDFNKREMSKTKLLTSTPVGGKPYMHESLFDGAVNRMEEEAQKFNNPADVLQIPENVPPQLIKSLIGIIPGSQLNPAIFQDEAFKLELMNKIGSLPPAMQGFTERTGESGLHLGRKVIEGTVMNRLPMEAYIQNENDKAEDWVKLVKKVYGGAHNYDRTFRSGDGTSSVTINKFVGIDEDGNDIVENDISKLEGVEIIISQMKENDYMRQANREMNIGALQAIRPTESNAGILAVFEVGLAKGMDFTDDAEKEQVDKMCEQTLMLAELSNAVKLETLKTQLQQLTMQQQMTTQAGQAAQQGGGGGGGQAPQSGISPERQPVAQASPVSAPGRFEAAEQRAQ